MDPERWQHVARIYELSLEREPGERSAFLAEASRDDAELRREVESLLEHDGALPDRSANARSRCSGPRDESDLEPGTQLGPYHIDALLGAGGMGEVYAQATRGWIGRSLSRSCRRALAHDPQFRARFDREAGPLRRSPIHTSARSTTSAIRRASTSWSWSTSKARRSPRVSRRAAAARSGSDVRHRDRGRARRRPSPRDRPSGSEARQHHADARAARSCSTSASRSPPRSRR